MSTSRSALLPLVLLVVAPGHALATSFTITAPSTTARTLAAAETGVITAAGSLTVAGGTVAITVTGSATIDNAGSLRQSGTGRAIRDNTGGLSLGITNQAGALVQAADADAIQMARSNSNVTLDNYGTITSLNASAGGAQALDWNAITTGTNVVRNHATGVLRASAADAVRPGVNGVVVNEGAIEALPVLEVVGADTQASSSDGIDAQADSGVSVTNSGTISGRHGITGGETAAGFTISVTNQAGGFITGMNGSGINIDGAVASPGAATVVNDGTITGNFDAAHYTLGDGDGADVDGIVDLTNRGVIRGAGAGGAGNAAEGVAAGGGTIRNLALAEISGQAHGILVDDSNGGAAFGATSIDNAGLIRGDGGYAVRLIGNFADTVTNQVGGTLRGAGPSAALQTGDGNDVVVDRGAIIGSGGSAIDLEGGDDQLSIEAGASSIVGDISGGAGSNQLRFALGSPGGAFHYAGALSNFDDVRVESGAVTLVGASTYAGPTTLAGGSLLAMNATGSATGAGAVDVQAGALLGGSGSVAGPVAVQSGGALAPGASVGTLHTGGVDLTAGATLSIELDPALGASDLLAVSGAVSLSGSDLVLTLLSAPTAGQTFDILANDGNDAIGGLFAQGALVTGSFSGQLYSFTIDYLASVDGGALGNDVRLTSVPEPSALLLLGLGGLAFVRRR